MVINYRCLFLDDAAIKPEARRGATHIIICFFFNHQKTLKALWNKLLSVLYDGEVG